MPGATSSAGRPSLSLARVDKSVIVIAALGLLPHDDKIGTARFARQGIAWKIECRSPFDVSVIAGHAAEPVSSLRQRCVHLLNVSFRGLFYDHAFCNEGRRNSASRDAYQRCIELPGKLRGNSDPLFRNAIDIDIDH
jgi:hypothetical protein